MLAINSIDLDLAVDAQHKHHDTNESNSTAQKSNSKGNHKRVTHVENHRDKQQGDQKCSDQHQNETKEEESKHVVDSVEPERVVNEVHLYGNGSEGENACNQGHVGRLQVPGLFWNLPWDLINFDRHLNSWPSKSQERTKA
ncbi:hypothetical protein OGATHE_001785 [Ogataea polymorpha]|uniref:Uncharacterized protein n=1 Tax=Ogataea polymorpha TaxID=460523 RepID=A0A9P8TCT8_9ASCO|nr:hypothetical protein OGATHE_001785 [Ogataea polymorpha]